MKRIIAALVASALFVSLAGCGAGPTKSQAPSSAAPSSSASSKPAPSSSSSEPAVEVSDTMRWINATYAILSKVNNWDFNLFGGTEPKGIAPIQMRNMLSEWWGVTDRKSADENLEWLLTEGHREGYKEIVRENQLDTFTRAEFDAAVAELNEEDQIFFNIVMAAYEQFGESALDAWDLSRAVQCVSSYYVAGFYTEEEALDRSLEICKTIQQTFTSWEDFAQSYMYGYQYWNEDDITDPESGSYARQKVYEAVKALPDSPFNVPWDTELTKTW